MKKAILWILGMFLGVCVYFVEAPMKALGIKKDFPKFKNVFA